MVDGGLWMKGLGRTAELRDERLLATGQDLLIAGGEGTYCIRIQSGLRTVLTTGGAWS